MSCRNAKQGQRKSGRLHSRGTEGAGAPKTGFGGIWIDERQTWAQQAEGWPKKKQGCPPWMEASGVTRGHIDDGGGGSESS